MEKKAITVVVLVFLVSIFSSISGDAIKQLEQTQFSFSSQGNETTNVSGCTNISANNYNENATDDDGSCDFDLDDDGVLDVDEIAGCTNSAAKNFVANATDDDGSCTYTNYENGSFQHHYWQGYSHGALIRQHEESFAKFSPDGSYYATHHDGIIQIWDTNNASITHSIHKTISDFSGYWVVDLDWAPDGDQIAIIVTSNLKYRGVSWTSEVMTYDLDSEESTSLGIHYYNRNYDIEYSPDGSYVGAALGNEIVVYDLLSGEKILNYSSGECTFFCGSYNYLSWGPSTKNLTLATNMFGQIGIYDFESQSIINQSDSWYGEKSLKFSPDGNMMALCTNDDDVALINLENLTMVWEQLTTPETYYSYVYNSACNEIAWSPDSTRFAIAYDGNGNHASSVLIYDAQTSAVVDWFGLSRQYECEGWNCASIEGLDWSPDGERIIFAADNKQQGIHTWIFDDDIEFIPGCTEYTATNYDPNATRLDYSCRFMLDDTYNDNYHQSYWDFCEWDDNIGEYLCWMEDLNDLSADEIEELDDCEQSENGCETELYCQEIHRTYGTWECAYYDYDDDNPDNAGTSEESSFPFEESVIFTIIGMIVFVIIMLNANKRNPGVSKIEIEYNDEEPEKEEVIEESPPKSIEINIRELL
jgi:hypothetical protein